MIFCKCIFFQTDVWGYWVKTIFFLWLNLYTRSETIDLEHLITAQTLLGNLRNRSSEAASASACISVVENIGNKMYRRPSSDQASVLSCTPVFVPDRCTRDELYIQITHFTTSCNDTASDQQVMEVIFLLCDNELLDDKSKYYGNYGNYNYNTLTLVKVSTFKQSRIPGK